MATSQELAREGRRESLDPRAAQTRAALIGAACELAAEGARTPSVRGITERAGLSRSSFYTQFASLTELSIAIFEDAFTRITAQDAQEREDHSASIVDITRHSVRALVDQVDALRDFYLAEGADTAAAHQRLMDGFTAQLRRSRGLSNAPRAGLAVDAAAVYISGGILGLLRGWVSGQIPGTATEITEQILLLLPPWLAEEDDRAAGRARSSADPRSRTPASAQTTPRTPHTHTTETKESS